MLLKTQNSSVYLSHSVVTHTLTNLATVLSSYVKQKGSKWIKKKVNSELKAKVEEIVSINEVLRCVSTSTFYLCKWKWNILNSRPEELSMRVCVCVFPKKVFIFIKITIATQIRSSKARFVLNGISLHQIFGGKIKSDAYLTHHPLWYLVFSLLEISYSSFFFFLL